MNWQLIIIILYFVITMAIGLLASRKTKSSDSFVGAGMGVSLTFDDGPSEEPAARNTASPPVSPAGGTPSQTASAC